MRRHLALRRVKIASRWLVEELADCVWDAHKNTANAASGKHDDRIRAISMCVWVAHSWGVAVETESTAEVERKANKVDWQRRAIGSEEMEQEMSDMVENWLS
jgi:hypothetical protein